MPEGGGARPEDRVEVRQFLCAEIYEEGMAERVEAANAAAMAYYEEEDTKK